MESSPAYSLNPAAGTHPVVSDPLEVAAAARAGERAMSDFPYYQARYAERGRLFALTDGAWLVTLCSGEWPFIQEQVLWLGRVLSSRGIPRWLLECHLRVLHEELAGALPERAESYGGLVRAADHLQRIRVARLPDRAFQRIARSFDQQVGPVWQSRLPRMGEILVAAGVDESEGIEGAVPSVEEWCTDPDRFPEVWRRAVTRTLEEARGSL